VTVRPRWRGVANCKQLVADGLPPRARPAGLCDCGPAFGFADGKPLGLMHGALHSAAASTGDSGASITVGGFLGLGEEVGLPLAVAVKGFPVKTCSAEKHQKS